MNSELGTVRQQAGYVLSTEYIVLLHFSCERTNLYIDKRISGCLLECCLVSSWCDARCATKASLAARVAGTHIHHTDTSLLITKVCINFDTLLLRTEIELLFKIRMCYWSLNLGTGSNTGNRPGPYRLNPGAHQQPELEYGQACVAHCRSEHGNLDSNLELG